MGTLCLRPDWVHSARFSLGCGRVQGMQGLGVLALVVVAPCGFAAHVAPEEAVLSSPRNRCGNGIYTNVKNTTQVAKFAPSLGPVRTEALGLGASGLGASPPLFGTANQPLLWDCTTYPPGTEALGPPPEPLYPPPPHRASFNCCEICSVPGGCAPTTYPPGTEALGPPPRAPT